MKRFFRTMLVVMLMASAVACGGAKKQTTDRPASMARIEILVPKAGDLVSGKTFDVRLKLTGGRIVKQVSLTHLTPNEGHVHVSLDGQIRSMTFGLSDHLATPKAGQHLLQAEFVAKDHGPFNPRVLNTVTFTVK